MFESCRDRQLNSPQSLFFGPFRTVREQGARNLATKPACVPPKLRPGPTGKIGISSGTGLAELKPGGTMIEFVFGDLK